MTRREITHARHDPAHVLVPGLFRCLGPRDRKRLKLDVAYVNGKDRIEFKGFEPLGPEELRVLQGLVALAGPTGRMLRDRPGLSDPADQLLTSLFTPPGTTVAPTERDDTLVVREGLRSLARVIGMDEGGKGLRDLTQSIERLFMVTVFVQRDSRRVGTRLLSTYRSDSDRADFRIALNPRLARVVLGELPQHVRIEMDEVRAIHAGPTRLIHQRLCGWIDGGKEGRIGLEKLMVYAWPDPGTPGAIRTRRVKVRKALAELVGMGWSVREYEPGKYAIARPEAPERVPEMVHVGAAVEP